jgi:hypothetical protein
MAFHAQPDSISHAAWVPFDVHGRDVPLQDPMTVVSHWHPGVVVHTVCDVCVAQLVVVGVPVQRGPVENVSVAEGARMIADLQQTCAVQSLLCLHVLGQDLLQTPLQQISPSIVSQSVDCVHCFGHGVDVVFKQSPSTPRFGSISLTDVQQTSLLSVAQSDEPVHAFGQCPGGKQMGSL